jgi:hypothetical protein
MVNLHATLVHHFLELAVADRIGHVPADAPQDHLPLKMAALELDHHLPSHRNQSRQSYSEAEHHRNLRQNPTDYAATVCVAVLAGCAVRTGAKLSSIGSRIV